MDFNNPICSMVLEYLPTYLPQKSPSHVGKYTSTIEHLGTFINISSGYPNEIAMNKAPFRRDIFHELRHRSSCARSLLGLPGTAVIAVAAIQPWWWMISSGIIRTNILGIKLMVTRFIQ